MARNRRDDLLRSDDLSRYSTSNYVGKRARSGAGGPLTIGTGRDYSRRSAVSDYAKMRRKRQRRKRILTGVLIALIAVLVAGVAGAWAYVNSVNNNLHEGLDSDFASVLTEPAHADDPYYVLLLGTDGRDEDVFRSDTIILTRIDPGQKTATMVSIPRDTRVQLGNHGYQKINAAHAYGGPQYVVETVNDLCGVKIAHYVEIDFMGFIAAVDAIGGVQVDVPVAIDAIDYGADVPAGLNWLNGEQCLSLCRSRNFPNGDYQRQIHQQLFLRALASQLLASDKATMASAITAMADYVTTDLDVSSIISMAASMRGMDPSTSLYTLDAQLWSNPETISGISYVIPDKEKLAHYMGLIDSGLDPMADVTDETVEAAASAPAFNPANYSVTVRNGAGIAGCAAAAAEKLTNAGYAIESTGNTDSFVYDETLVIYEEDDQAAVADEIVAKLGVGRTVQGNGRYSYDGDLLVVVGKDWRG